MDRMLRNKKTILLFLLPSLIIFTATVVIPILWSGYYSLYNKSGKIKKFEKIYIMLEKLRKIKAKNRTKHFAKNNKII